MREEQNETRLTLPLGLRRRYELVDDALRRVGKVSELGLRGYAVGRGRCVAPFILYTLYFIQCGAWRWWASLQPEPHRGDMGAGTCLRVQSTKCTL